MGEKVSGQTSVMSIIAAGLRRRIASGELKPVTTKELTRVQREVLTHCPDWSAPFEINWRRHEATGEIVSLTSTEQALGRLRNLGLVEHSPANDTYRITEAGRLALKPGAQQ